MVPTKKPHAEAIGAGLGGALCWGARISASRSKCLTSRFATRPAMKEAGVVLSLSPLELEREGPSAAARSSGEPGVYSAGKDAAKASSVCSAARCRPKAQPQFADAQRAIVRLALGVPRPRAVGGERRRHEAVKRDGAGKSGDDHERADNAIATRRAAGDARIQPLKSLYSSLW